ncbi:MAG: SDR family oxidoreductase [Methylobacterium sp.]|jgi:short-subunit dehydrogenase|nr:SDR family oxidoreductase [Methylobacterium sp.]
MTEPAPTARTALITGASSGIGKALAANFARDGWNLVLAARSVDKMRATADELGQRHGITATVIRADLETGEGAAQLHADVKRRGIVISALVNNAGFGTSGPFKESDLASDLAMMQLNMTAVVALTKLFMPDLLAARGKLLNVASTAAFLSGPYMAIYYATKAFVLSFSEALATELEGTGVTVTTLCPGPTASDFWSRSNMQETGLVKGKKLPTSEDVAAAGYRAMERGDRIFIPGIKNWLMAQSTRITPRRVTASVAARMNRSR